MKTLSIAAALIAVSVTSVANAGMIGGAHPDKTASSAVWTFPDSVVDSLQADLSVALNGLALVKTTGPAGTELSLTSQAVPFSSPQPGPGVTVGELLTSDFITGTQGIAVKVPDYGTYDFTGFYNVLGGQEQMASFSITFETSTGIPEPAAFGLLSIAGCLGFRRRR